jgi:hypothetical protein
VGNIVHFLNELKEYMIEDKKLIFNPAYVNQLNVFKERIKIKFDNIFLVTGMEGTGKSRGIAIPTAFYLSGRNIKIVFTFEQFEKAYSEIKTGGTIIWDEFIFSGMGADALSEMQKNLIKIMATGREDHLVNVILIVPAIFLLKNYFAVFRALCQIHTDSPDFLTRGNAYFYSFEDKRILYNLNKKTQYTDLNRSSFGFKFYNNNIEDLYDMELYKKLKKEAIDSIGKDKKEDKVTLSDKIVFKAINYMENTLDMNIKEVSEALIEQYDAFRTFKSRLTQKILKYDVKKNIETETN